MQKQQQQEEEEKIVQEEEIIDHQTSTIITKRRTYNNHNNKSTSPPPAAKRVGKLTIYRPENQTLPSNEQVKSMFDSFQDGFQKLGSIIGQTLAYIFYIIHKIFVIYLFGGIVYLFAQFNKKCLKKLNTKDPFKRTRINVNYGRLKELNESYDQYGQKAFSLILDLDETLIYTSSRKKWEDCLECEIKFKSGSKSTLYVKKRPYLDEFLQEISKYYNIYIYTASEKEYADCIIDKIDQYNVIPQKRRYYRDHCTKYSEGYIKDLSYISKDLSRVVMIDNSSFATQLNTENTFIISAYKGKDEGEDRLLQFQTVLELFVDKKTDFRDQITKIKDQYF